MNENCPCGSGKEYFECCELIHNDMSKATVAEELMRSRYTAFTLGNGDYLMESHHSSTRPISDKIAIVDWANSVRWLRLEIINSTNGMKTDNEGTVEFKAFYSEGYKEKVIHENSKFVKENGNWLYLGVV